MDDDSIYTFINRYKNYLLYELLSPEKRQYNKTEQASYITSSLDHDERFKPGIEYVRYTLLAFQRERTIKTDTTFPPTFQTKQLQA